MYEHDGIMYAGDVNKNIIKVVGFKYLYGYKLLLTFSTGEKKVYDVEPLLKLPVFQPLADIEIFKDIQLIFNTISWLDESVDIAPETLYNNSVPYTATMLA